MFNLILLLVQNVASDAIYDDTYRYIPFCVVIAIGLSKFDSP